MIACLLTTKLKKKEKKNANPSTQTYTQESLWPNFFGWNINGNAKTRLNWISRKVEKVSIKQNKTKTKKKKIAIPI